MAEDAAAIAICKGESMWGGSGECRCQHMKERRYHNCLDGDAGIK